MEVIIIPTSQMVTGLVTMAAGLIHQEIGTTNNIEKGLWEQLDVNYASILCDKAIKTGKPICLIASGRSMWPIITEGMRAVISPLQAGLPAKGSLLLIRRADGLIVHRYWGIIYKEGIPLVLTKGDTNLAFDPPVPVSMVLGQVSQLRNSLGECRDLKRGWVCLLGRILCSSYFLASIWARFCRMLLS
jgi:hypothetical protein